MKEKRPIKEVKDTENVSLSNSRMSLEQEAAEEKENELERKEMDDERKQEHINEVRDAHFDCWFDDHNTALKEDYIEESFDDFMEYCREQYKLENE